MRTTSSSRAIRGVGAGPRLGDGARARDSRRKALLEALESGDFYASTGVVLDDVAATATALTVRVKTDGTSKYRIRFIGRGGQVLREATEPTATYTFTGDEGYVRAKVLESNGRMAWVQPVQVARQHGWRGRRAVDSPWRRWASSCWLGVRGAPARRRGTMRRSPR